jgi:hypothetical protein
MTTPGSLGLRAHIAPLATIAIAAALEEVRETASYLSSLARE